MTVDTYEFYNTYKALKLHFTTDNYDIVKYEGKTQRSLKSSKNLASRIVVFTQRYKKFQLIEYMVANFIKGDNYGGIFNDIDGDDIYVQWKQRTENLTYNFKKDINTIKDSLKNDNISTLFESDGSHPLIMKLYMGKYVMIETVVILDCIYEFTDKLDSVLKEDFMWNKFKRLVCKYRPFLNLDKEKYESIIENTI